MRQHTRAGLLFLIPLLGTIALAPVPDASAEADRRDWTGWIAAMDRALAGGEPQAAAAAWREAYVAAHLSRDWPGMIAVGDAAVRAGRAAGAPEVFTPRARRAYLTALLRARRQASYDGMQAAADAFGRLGDREIERQARSLAVELAGRAETDARRARAH
jgi:hypothetical protein